MYYLLEHSSGVIARNVTAVSRASEQANLLIENCLGIHLEKENYFLDNPYILALVVIPISCVKLCNLIGGVHAPSLYQNTIYLIFVTE